MDFSNLPARIGIAGAIAPTKATVTRFWCVSVLAMPLFSSHGQVTGPVEGKEIDNPRRDRRPTAGG